MHDVVFLRQAAAIAMLSVASYSDIKSRKVSDLVWIFFGGAGTMLYLFEPASFVTILYIGVGVAVGIAGILSKVFGQADCLALVATSIAFPAP